MDEHIEDDSCTMAPGAVLDYAEDMISSQPVDEELGCLDILVLTGLSNDFNFIEIGEQLSYSEITVSIIAELAVKKLNCKSEIGAVSKAIRLNLI